MSQDIDAPSFLPPNESFSWFQVWTKALTHPSITTFEELICDPKGTIKRACIWILFIILICNSFSIFSQIDLKNIFTFPSLEYWQATRILKESITESLTKIPSEVILSLLVLTISVGIIQAIALTLGGSGTYSKLLYAFATFLSPLTVIASILSLLPAMSDTNFFIIRNYINFTLGLYGIVLSVIAVKAVHQFSWVKAVVSISSIFVGAIIVLVVVSAIALILLGPAMNGLNND